MAWPPLKSIKSMLVFVLHMGMGHHFLALELFGSENLWKATNGGLEPNNFEAGLRANFYFDKASYRMHMKEHCVGNCPLQPALVALVLVGTCTWSFLLFLFVIIWLHGSASQPSDTLTRVHDLFFV